MTAATLRLRDAALAALLAASASLATAGERETARVLTATTVLEELRASRDQAIPDRLLERAYGIAVVPDVIKVGFGIGGRRGKGVLVVRDKDGKFSNPVFIALTGGSIGWQIGAQSTDIVLVFTTREGVEGITDGKVTLGADASVAAGPVGRQASAATDTSLNAEVYSYSRNRGIFAGVALDGSAITIDKSANAAFYGKRSVVTSDILDHSVTSTEESAMKFMAMVNSSTGGTRPAGQTPVVAQPSVPPQPTPSDSPVSPLPSGEAPPPGQVKVFPLDPQQ